MQINNIFYENAKTSVKDFLKEEFSDFPLKMRTRILDFFYKVSNYEEEGVKLKPSILFTNKINEVVNTVPKSFKLVLFTDEDESLFNSRMKCLLAFSKHDWTIFVDIQENQYTYGICKTFNSVKDKNFNQLIFNNEILKTKNENKIISLILLESFNSNCITLKSLSQKRLNINLSLATAPNQDFEDVIKEFVTASFSKLRTTKRKLKEIKTLYQNIFENAFKNINGAICVVVDKDYEDKGFLSDGIWLETPIEFSKLFLQSKSFDESKLLSMSNLFIDMLNYDGITIVDNLGRIRAYNVFVETNTNRTRTIVGGARKRAAYTIINSRRKRIIGAYFQSHDGEILFETVKK